jgi:hypothetical protein
MPSDRDLLERLYDRFNARDMEAALATKYTDVTWATRPRQHEIESYRATTAGASGRGALGNGSAGSPASRTSGGRRRCKLSSSVCA